MDYELKEIEKARNELSLAIHEYCKVVLKDNDYYYNERLIAGVQAFLQVNYYREMYMPVVGVEIADKKWWEFWK